MFFILKIAIGIVIGGISGAIAGAIMKSSGGTIKNIILGIVGGFVGSLVFGLIGFKSTNIIGTMITSIAGAYNRTFLRIRRSAHPAHPLHRLHNFFFNLLVALSPRAHQGIRDCQRHNRIISRPGRTGNERKIHPVCIVEFVDRAHDIIRKQLLT